MLQLPGAQIDKHDGTQGKARYRISDENEDGGEVVDRSTMLDRL